MDFDLWCLLGPSWLMSLAFFFKERERGKKKEKHRKAKKERQQQQTQSNNNIGYWSMMIGIYIAYFCLQKSCLDDQIQTCKIDLTIWVLTVLLPLPLFIIITYLFLHAFHALPPKPFSPLTVVISLTSGLLHSMSPLPHVSVFSLFICLVINLSSRILF